MEAADEEETSKNVSKRKHTNTIRVSERDRDAFTPVEKTENRA